MIRVFIIHLASSVEMFLVVSETEQCQKGIGIASSPMTETITFLQQATMPGHFTATLCCLEVTTVIVCLRQENRASDSHYFYV